MMRSLRVAWRASAILGLTLASYCVLLLSQPLKRFAGRFQQRLRNAVFHSWARGFARFAGMRITVTGKPPSGPFLLVANHLSYMDIPLLATQVDAAFVAKADLRHWPVLGHAFLAADTIYVDRSQRRDVVRVTRLVEDCLERGLGVVLFPEATSSKGASILPFKPSLLELAARRNYPVHFASLGYRTPEGLLPAHDAVCWWGDAPFTPHALRLLRLPSFDATLHFGDQPIRQADRKQLAQELRSAMIGIFTPVVEEEIGERQKLAESEETAATAVAITNETSGAAEH